MHDREIHKLFSLSLDLLCVAGTDGTFKKLNPAFSRTLGYSIEEMIDKPFIDFFHPDDVAKSQKEVEKLAAGALMVGFENRYRCKDGSYKWIMWNCVPEVETGLLYACGRDITEQRKTEAETRQIVSTLNELALSAEKKSEKDLAASEKLLSTLIENIPVAVFLKDVKDSFRVTLWNSAAEQIFEVPKSTILGKTAHDLWPKSDADKYLSDDELVTQNKIKVDLQETSPTKSRGTMILRTRKIPISLGEADEPSYLLAICDDITKQKKQEQELLAQAEQLSTLFQAMKEGMCLQGSNGEVIQFNTAALSILGLTRDQLMDRSRRTPDWKALKEDESELPVAEYPALVALKAQKPVYDRLMGIRRGESGEIRWIKVNAVPFYFGSGDTEKELRVICTFADITEELRLQKTVDLERAKSSHAAKLASLGEMSAGIAHEINNPLAIIVGSSHLLRTHKANEQEIIAKVDKIEKAASRIEKIVKSLKKFSRSSELPVFKTEDLVTIVNEALVLTNAKAHRASVPISLDISGTPQIECNAGEIEQVLVNLINNGIDAVTDSPERWIRIRAFETSTALVVQVIDSGPGISPATESKIFQPFFTTKPLGEGTGLGLSISKGILDQHSAKFFLNRESPNTCFEIHFPKKK